MLITLPDSAGWSAMHIAQSNWGHIALIVKREWQVVNGSTVPDGPVEEIITKDAFSSRHILGETRLLIEREAETALFKTFRDIFILGGGTEANDSVGRKIVSAELFLNTARVASFIKVGDEGPDPVNIFGYEPRSARIVPKLSSVPPVPFDLDAKGGNLFRGMRRSDGFVPSEAMPAFVGDLSVTAQTTSRSETGVENVDVVADVSVRVPRLRAVPFVWEGGANTPANWCRRENTPLAADTITIGADRVSVIWRAKLSLATYPLSDLRRIDFKEAA